MSGHEYQAQPNRLSATKRSALVAGLLFLLGAVFPQAQAESCDEFSSNKDPLCVEITGGVPNPNSPEAKWAKGEEQRPPSRAKYWDFLGSYDKHILPGQCWAVSPTVFVGRNEEVFYFVSVSVGGTWNSPRVIVQSEAGTEPSPTPFHAYKQGLGIWTETLPFLGIDREIGEHNILLGFSPERSRTITRNFRNMLSFRMRLRFGPVHDAFDSPNITLNGFNQAFDRVDHCNRRRQNQQR